MNEFTTYQQKIGIKRLTRLVEYLEDLPKEHFNLKSWASYDEPNYDPLVENFVLARRALRDIREGACRTAACACGHAAMIPEFKRAGLKLVVDDVDPFSISATFHYHPPKTIFNYEGIEAASMFFKISQEDANRLFMPNQYPHGKIGRDYVTSRIKSYIKKAKRALDD